MIGFLLIDKPAGMTSHDVVNRIRKLTGERKVGHAGTLDPFATGLLIVGVGRKATKQLGDLVGLDKEYEAIFILGATSETDDPEGPITSIETRHTLSLHRDEIETAMQKFVGQIDQVPPRYAAIKVKGKKLYEAARAGEKIERKPRSVRIDAFELLEFPLIRSRKGSIDTKIERIKVRVKCGSGTYIRAMARDLGEKLGVGGYVEELRRTKIGIHRVEDATPLDQFTSGNISEKIKQALA